MFENAPKGWKEVNFNSFFEVLSSKKYQIQKQDYLEKGQIPIIDQGQSKIAGYTNNTNKIFNKKNVIIFGDHTRIVKYINFQFAIGADGTQILVTKNNIDLKFAYYQLLNKKFPDRGYSRHFKYVKTEKYYIPPTLQEQEEIVRVLDLASDMVRLRKACIQHTTDLIPAIFQEMFGDVENNKNNYPIQSIKNIIKINPAKNVLPDETDVTFLGMKDITEDGLIDLSIIKSFKDVKKGFTSFQNNDVLLAKITPCFENGKAAIVRNLTNGYGFGSTEFYILRPDITKILPEYLYSVIKSNRFGCLGKMNMKGAAGQKRLIKEFVLNYKLPLPPLEQQELFAQKVIEIEKYKNEQLEELEKFEQLFQSLLHRAFTGELTKHKFGENS